RACRARTGAGGAAILIAAARRGLVIDLELVHDVADATAVLRDVLGKALGLPVWDRPGERHHALDDHHLDLGGIELIVVHELIADVLADALIRAPIALRAAAGIASARSAAPLTALARTLAPRALPLATPPPG